MWFSSPVPDRSSEPLEFAVLYANEMIHGGGVEGARGGGGGGGGGMTVSEYGLVTRKVNHVIRGLDISAPPLTPNLRERK